MSRTLLLTIDSLINLILGALLMVFPQRLVSILGVPQADSAFYPSILGGILFGVGLALWIERRRQKTAVVGLGLGGAIAINLSGAIVLAVWLLAADLGLPLRGLVFLWSVVVLLVAVSAVEIGNVWRNREAA